MCCPKSRSMGAALCVGWETCLSVIAMGPTFVAAVFRAIGNRPCGIANGFCGNRFSSANHRQILTEMIQ